MAAPSLPDVDLEEDPDPERIISRPRGGEADDGPVDRRRRSPRVAYRSSGSHEDVGIAEGPGERATSESAGAVGAMMCAESANGSAGYTMEELVREFRTPDSH